MSRFTLFTGLLTATVLAAPDINNNARAQSGQVETHTLRSESADRRPIHISYFPGKPGSGGAENTPVVILLHGVGGDRLVWEQKGAGTTGKSFVDALQDNGYAVVSVDLRKHGESKTDKDGDGNLKPNDYRYIGGDLEGVKNFLYEEHQAKKLNMNKTAIIAADNMAAVAAAYAQYDWGKKPYDDAPATSPGARTPRGQDIRALVLLSPSQTAGPLNILGPMKYLRNPRIGLAVFIAYGTQDSEDRGLSKQLEKLLSGIPANKDRIYLKEYPVKFRGTDLTAKPILVEGPILAFLDKHLKQLDSEWRDRRSRLER